MMKRIDAAVREHQAIKDGDGWLAGINAPPEYCKKYLTDWLSTLSPGVILDWGCRTGHYMDIMKELGFKAEGLEVMAKYVSKGVSSGRTIVLGDCHYTEDYFPASYFDYVWAHHTLEHLEYPKESLSSLRKVVKLGGLAYMIFPAQTPTNPYLTKHRCDTGSRRQIIDYIPREWKICELVRNKNWFLKMEAI